MIFTHPTEQGNFSFEKSSLLFQYAFVHISALQVRLISCSGIFISLSLVFLPLFQWRSCQRLKRTISILTRINRYFYYSRIITRVYLLHSKGRRNLPAHHYQTQCLLAISVSHIYCSQNRSALFVAHDAYDCASAPVLRDRRFKLLFSAAYARNAVSSLKLFRPCPAGFHPRFKQTACWFLPVRAKAWPLVA